MNDVEAADLPSPSSPSAIFIEDRSTDGDASAGVATVTVVDVSAAIGAPAGSAGGAAGAQGLVESFRHTGFAVITGHEVDLGLFERFCAESADFFALPLDEKMRVGFPAPEVIRGYEPVPDQSGPARAPNLMESLLINQLEPVGDYPVGSPQAKLWRWPNLWPERPASLRPVWEDYYRAMTALGDRLLELVALGVGLPRDWFADKFDRHFNNLAANHYPPRVGGLADSPMLRNRPHTDHGALTLLYRPSEPGGLEVFADSRWWQVPFIPGSLVINIGDMLERWTGGLLPATPHRVVKGEDPSVGRYSVAYFQQPNPDALVAPALPVAAGRPDYSPVVAGEHISRKELGYHTVTAALNV
ncbi:isopenicillin N synthase family dioxygenase [Pseudofrankia saprophytica]|uniref:isopenicillin N synthase family dioxygenase n=1 Tax=Pseudofrankia saprophytica TaxID=298655 RepID=UPI000234B4AA|nr:2OG-Fe(II) oxygenase family protein [Pseudofrankia saprophytica]